MLPRIYRDGRQSSSVVVRKCYRCLRRGAAVVDVDDRVARGPAQPCQDGRVGSGRKGNRNCGFSSVAWRESGGGDFGGVRRVILPIVVCVEKNAVAIVKLERRILERVRHAGR